MGVGVVVRRYIDFLILLIPTPLVSVLFYSSIPTFCSLFKMFFYIIKLSHYTVAIITLFDHYIATYTLLSLISVIIF